MHLNYFVAIATLLTTTVTSTAINAIIEPEVVTRDNTNNTLTARGGPGVYWCSLRLWGGYCDWVPVDALSQGMYWEPGWQGSIGPDHGVVCQIFDDTACHSEASVPGIRYPGIADLDASRNLHALLSRPSCIRCVTG